MHLLDIDQFDKKFFLNFFEEALEMEKIVTSKKHTNILANRIVATIFYEPSTRTRMSFESAALRLGAKVISSPDMVKISSAYKGETLFDTAKMLSSYTDCLIIRHPVEGSAKKLAKGSSVPVINAGDGATSHPTQSFLDIYTIYKEKKSCDNLHIAFVGDLKYGRTVHSLSQVLAHFDNVHITYISPQKLSIPQKIKDILDTHTISYTQTENLEAIKEADVIYNTRIQKERFEDINEYNQYKGVYVFNKQTMEKVQKNAILMHPLPRVDEIDPEIDGDPRSIYFTQAANGLVARMALLKIILT